MTTPFGLNLSPELHNALKSSAEVWGGDESPDDKRARVYNHLPAPGMYIQAAPLIYSKSLAHEASQAVDSIQSKLGPFPTQEQHYEAAQMFLDAMNCSVRNPLDCDALDARVAFTVKATLDFPAIAWSEGALIRGLRTFQFFPSVADVVLVLTDELKPIRDMLSRLKIVILKSSFSLS